MAVLRCLVFLSLLGVTVTGQAQIAFRAAASNFANTLTVPAGLTINKPAGTVLNDVLVASIAVQPSGVVLNAPAGWVVVQTTTQPGGVTSKLTTWYKLATGAEPASYTWTTATVNSTGIVGGIAAFSGVDPTTPIDTSNGNTTPSSLTHTANQVTTLSANTMLVGAFEFQAGLPWTPAGGMTEALDVQSGGGSGKISLEMTYEARAAIGATGTRTATATGGAGLADFGAAQLVALRVRPVIDHFSINHAGTGVACIDADITITAHDNAHTAVDANATTVSLTTTTGKGTWVAITAGGGTLVDATPGDGAANYTFAVGSNSVVLSFRYTNLAGATETFGFNVSGGGFSETTGVANATDDPAFTMERVGFAFMNITDGNTTVPMQLSGKPSNTGLNAKTIRVRAVNTTNAGTCTPLFASQTRTIQMGAECNSPAACAAQLATINGTAISTSADNGGAGAAAYSNVSLAFNAASEADAVIAYPDAGQISLHARYDLDAAVAGFEMQGSSNAFVVRPFGFALRGANAATAIAHGTTAAASVIAAAGDNFTMTLAAYNWAAGQDANNDGIPDAGVSLTGNGLTPNYAAATTVSATGNLPGIATGSIDRASGGSSTTALEWSGGAATVSDWRYSEVGNAFLGASAANYLGSGSSITGNSGLDGTAAAGGYVGRFRAKKLALSAATLANRAALLPCVSTFSYMGESMRLAFTLTAQNTQNGTTQNYSGAYAKHDPTNALTAFAPGARSGATNLTSRVDAFYQAAVPAWSSGQLVVPVSDPIYIAIGRASPDNPDGPRAATQLGIAPTDPDGAALATFNLDVDNDTVNEHGAAGGVVELRFGRLVLQNASGPGTGALPIAMTTQYWNGSGFVTNTADNCTALSRNQVELGSYVGGLAPGPNCRTYLLQSPVTFVSGAAILQLAAPGSGVTGSVLLRPNLGATTTGAYCTNAATPPTAPTTAAGMAYLLGRWDDAADPDANATTSHDDKPSARAVFGVFGSQPRNFIFQRENY